eukprot:GFYU01005634.1.p1 GENE.GFYU01005634.1~~GFYU01005634.1.p1  ORF type:complete len:169 (+),score=51.97 GFYU01005634.1:186-692(+)
MDIRDYTPKFALGHSTQFAEGGLSHVWTTDFHEDAHTPPVLSQTLAVPVSPPTLYATLFDGNHPDAQDCASVGQKDSDGSGSDAHSRSSSHVTADDIDIVAIGLPSLGDLSEDDGERTLTPMHTSEDEIETDCDNDVQDMSTKDHSQEEVSKAVEFMTSVSLGGMFAL